MTFLGGDRVGSSLQDLETQVASCGNNSDSENICTSIMNLQSVICLNKFSFTAAFLKFVRLVIRAYIYRRGASGPH